MGLFTSLLGLPLAPLRGTVWLAEQIAQEAEQQHYDPHTIRRQLLEVENARNAGELSEDEAAALERELIARLMEASQRRNPTRRTHE